MPPKTWPDSKVNLVNLASPNEVENRVEGLDYEDRMTIVSAVDQVLAANADSRADPGLKDDYVTWVALTVLSRLIVDSSARWGEGELGSATSPMRATRHGQSQPAATRMTRRAHAASQPERLLLNAIQGEYVLPQFRTLNFPIELRNLKQQLFQQCFSKGTFVPSAVLTSAVATHIATQQPGQPESPPSTSFGVLAARGRTLQVPGLKAPLTSKAVGAVLEYYGLAQRARREAHNGLYVRPWLIRRLLAIKPRHGILDLRNLSWMTDRYRVYGQPLESIPARLADLNGANPGAGE